MSVEQLLFAELGCATRLTGRCGRESQRELLARKPIGARGGRGTFVTLLPGQPPLNEFVRGMWPDAVI